MSQRRPTLDLTGPSRRFCRLHTAKITLSMGDKSWNRDLQQMRRKMSPLEDRTMIHFRCCHCFTTEVGNRCGHCLRGNRGAYAPVKVGRLTGKETSLVGQALLIKVGGVEVACHTWSRDSSVASSSVGRFRREAGLACGLERVLDKIRLPLRGRPALCLSRK